MSVGSDVDTTVPADNEKAVKSEIRANFSAIKTEIEELQRKTDLPWRIATGVADL